jgi:YebC/PmpR family DNA-binding regulatory protein
MAGHSKFKNIMHRKGAQDRKRAGLFAKLGREISTAARMGGVEIDSNARLRAAITAARGENMPKDNIERAIQKGSNRNDTECYEAIRYEGYGIGGIAVIVETLTDNRNRTSSEIRSAFSKHGGNLGETGSVLFLFDHVGEITYPNIVADEDAMFEIALEKSADDVETHEDSYAVFCSPDRLHEIAHALENSLGAPNKARLVWRPKNTIMIDQDQAVSLLKLMSILDDNEDIQDVYANFEIADDVLMHLNKDL